VLPASAEILSCLAHVLVYSRLFIIMAMPTASFDAAAFNPVGPVMQQVEVWYTLLFCTALCYEKTPTL